MLVLFIALRNLFSFLPIFPKYIRIDNYIMTACVLSFAVPPERLGHDASRYMEPEIGPTWPQEAHEVIVNDLRPELQNPEKTASLMDQLNSRGFAVLKHSSQALGSLETQAEWNAACIDVSVY